MIRQPNEQTTPIDQMEQFAMAVVEIFCSIVCMPVEIILRPRYGTRYFPVYVTAFSCMMMIFLTAFSSVASTVVGMIPFTNVAIPAGRFDLWSFTELMFFLLFVHGIRLWRRMIYLDLERFSRFEGEALFIFRLMPGGSSFYLVRIFLEPATVFLLASALQRFYIITPGLATYLHFAALMLAMKCMVFFVRGWQFARNLADAANYPAIYEKIIENSATSDEMAQVQLASIAKLPADTRKAVVTRIARLSEPEQSR